MSKEEIFAIIDDELEKRKLDTFLLWDFPNAVKKRIEELYQSVDNAKPCEAFECLEEIIHEFNEPHYELSGDYSYKNKLLERCENEVNIIKQALLKAQEQEKVLKALATLKQNMKVEIDYGKDQKDISCAIVFYIDGKKTIYVVDEAIKELNPKHFEELENLKEVLE